MDTLAVGQAIDFNSKPKDYNGATHLHHGKIVALKKSKKQISIKVNSNEQVYTYLIDEIKILSINKSHYAITNNIIPESKTVSVKLNQPATNTNTNVSARRGSLTLNIFNKKKKPKNTSKSLQRCTSEPSLLSPKSKSHNKTNNSRFASVTNKISKGWTNFSKYKLQIHKNKVFGVDPLRLDRTLINNKDYKSSIPNILIKLKQELFAHNGHLIEGIFRKAPNVSDCKKIKNDINNGKDVYTNINFENINGVLIANLIKVFFRDLPKPILEDVEKHKIEKIKKTQNIFLVSDIINNSINEPNKSYFKWLLDLCIDIVKYENVNKMTCKNMAVVMSPNLYNDSKIENPIKLLNISAAAVVFLQISIEWRMKQ